MDLVGKKLGKYEIQAEIGRGGMGTVYKGYDPILDRHLAVKVIAEHLVREREFVERFLREARAAARLRHPNIVTIHDVGEEAGLYYFVMEYVDGEDLKAILSRRGFLPVEEVAPILKQVASGLDYAHQLGIVHRDVKPANVLVRKDGQVLLTDFGIAKAAYESKITATGTALGTPEYMAPEQALGQDVSPATDQYALGVVAYEMLAGRPPFLADSTTAVLYMQAHEPLPPIRGLRPDLPAEVEAVLSRALAKSPSERFPNCMAFAEAMGQAARAGAAPGAVAQPAAPAVAPIPTPAPTAPPAYPVAPVAPRPPSGPAVAGGPAFPTPAVTPPAPVAPFTPAAGMAPAYPTPPGGTPAPSPAAPVTPAAGMAPAYPTPPVTPPGQAAIPYAPPARRKGLPAWAWVLIGLGGLAVLACVAVVAVLVVQGTSETRAAAATQTAEAQVRSTAAAREQTRMAATAAVQAQATQTAAVQAQATAMAEALYNAYLLTASQWPLAFAEPFETNVQGWDEGEYTGERANGYRSFTGGTYYWYAEAIQGVVWRSIPENMPELSDFYVTVEGRQISGAPTCWYGLVLRQDGGNYYYFEIGDAGKFRFSKYNGDWTTLLGSTYSETILPGQTNRLTVIAQGERFVLYINDQFVGEVYDDELISGTAGFAIEMDEGETAEFEFDNFEVRAP